MGINNTELRLETAWYCHVLCLQRTWVQHPPRDAPLPAMSVPEGSSGLCGHTHVVHTHTDAHKYVRLSINPELRCLWKRREYERNIRAPAVLTHSISQHWLLSILIYYFYCISVHIFSNLCWSFNPFLLTQLPLVFRTGESWQVWVSSRSLALHHTKIPTGLLFSRQRKWKFGLVPMNHQYLEVTCFI